VRHELREGVLDRLAAAPEPQLGAGGELVVHGQGAAAPLEAGGGAVVVLDDEAVAVVEAEVAGGAGHGPMMQRGCDRERVPVVPKVQVSGQIQASPDAVWTAVGRGGATP
jgi:hypothetical protein